MLLTAMNNANSITLLKSVINCINIATRCPFYDCGEFTIYVATYPDR